MKGPRRSLLLIALVLAGCGPGSGGSGLPSSSADLEPAPSPMPSPTPSPVPPALACGAPDRTRAEPWTGLVEAVDGDCLRVAGRTFDLAGAVIVRRSGQPVEGGALAVGQSVTVEPVAEDPARARLVVIEDGGG